MKKLKLSQCNILQSSNCVFFDVDDTLIKWGPKHLTEKKMDSPYKELQSYIEVEDPGMIGHKMKFMPHLSHCHLLIRNFNQGRTIIVWSAAGWAWASTIVKALGLEKYVSLILDKPTKYVDDIPMEQWFCSRTFINDMEGGE